MGVAPRRLTAARDLREDLCGDLAQLAARLDQVVTQDIYRADQRATEQHIGQVEAGLVGLRSEHDQITERGEGQRREDQAVAAAIRRLVISSFVAPLLLMALQLWLLSRAPRSRRCQQVHGASWGAGRFEYESGDTTCW
ncbi:hypothetical protein OG897_32535 [Streptomyces sp. NBC_00237]|uniref:hypothetical protein n=1 Tax=Streptomyces sp. NBC_00237 TaxID=2975687 RepID=UPI0022518CB5|nr:hypothetical protein [Streptomyces sp. NBC_00237]MCX5206125.1 hypothetical protein [Streptomyces sp. NBC_00237]